MLSYRGFFFGLLLIRQFYIDESEITDYNLGLIYNYGTFSF